MRLYSNPRKQTFWLVYSKTHLCPYVEFHIRTITYPLRRICMDNIPHHYCPWSNGVALPWPKVNIVTLLRARLHSQNPVITSCQIVGFGYFAQSLLIIQRPRVCHWWTKMIPQKSRSQCAHSQNLCQGKTCLLPRKIYISHNSCCLSPMTASQGHICFK